MGLEQETEPTREETDALLGQHETGVLSLARDERSSSCFLATAQKVPIFKRT